MTMLVLALAAFVGTHFLLSHPLRAPLVGRVGEGGFAGLYSVVALAMLAWAAWAFRAAPAELWWIAPDWLWTAGAVVLLAAAILLVGSVTAPNPALLGMGNMAGASGPRGVQRITRHPMMWAIGLWAIVHGALGGNSRAVVLALGIGALALIGAKLQDGKKRAQLGPGWSRHAADTSYWPLGQQLRGRSRWGTVWPGWVAVVGGVALYALATWLHPRLGAPLLGLWRTIG